MISCSLIEFRFVEVDNVGRFMIEEFYNVGEKCSFFSFSFKLLGRVCERNGRFCDETSRNLI